MELWRKYNTATTIYFPLITAGAADFITSASHASGDTQIIKDGGAAANTTNAFAHEGNGIYSLALTATEMQAAKIQITIIDQGTKAYSDQAIIIVTYGNASAEFAFDLSVATQSVNVTQFGGSNGTFASGRPEVNTTHFGGTAGTFASGRPETNMTHIAGSAVSTSTAQIGVNVVNAAGTAWNSGAISASTLAADTLTAAKVAADVGTEIATAVWANATRTLTAGTNIDGSTFTAIPWNAAWDAEVQSEVDDALIAKGLDHLVFTSVTGTDIADNSIIARMVSKSATADWDSYNNTTDSLEALRDRGDAAWITATGFSTHSAADVWAVATRVLTAGTNIVLAKGTGITGFNDLSAAQVNSEVDTALADIRLDELLAADSDIDGAAPPTVGSVFHELMTKSTGSFTYDQTTDSLEAIRDRGDAAWITATGFSTHSAADVWAVATRTLTAGTNINGSTFTAIPWNAAWDAEVQSEVQDAIEANHLDHLLAVTYDPASKPGAADALLNELVESDAGVARFTANALEQAPTGGAAPTAAQIADAVWEEAIADHSGTAGSTAEALAAAGSAGDPWATALPGSYSSGQAGHILGNRLDAAVSSRSSHSVSDVWNAGTRTLTAGTNIALAKGTGITGFNDLSASDVRTAVGLASANLDTQLARSGPIIYGTATASSSSSLTLGAEAAAVSNEYRSQILTITSGAGAGQSRLITSYTSGRVASVSPSWGTTPDSNAGYRIDDANAVDVRQIGGGATAITNLTAAYDGTGYAGGTIKQQVDIVSLSGDTTAADNAEAFFDGTGYAGTNNVIPTVTTVNGLAANSVNASALAADAVAEIQSGLSTLTASQVNAEMVDVLATDTYAEPSGVPGATVPLSEKIGRIYQALRNRVDVTAGKKTFYNDADSALWEKDLSDDGTTYSESEGNSV